jgi:hypothetical protein
MTAPSAASSRQVKINGKSLEPAEKRRKLPERSTYWPFILLPNWKRRAAIKYFVLFLQNRFMFALYFFSALDIFGSLVREIFPFFSVAAV